MGSGVLLWGRRGLYGVSYGAEGVTMGFLMGRKGLYGVSDGAEGVSMGSGVLL